MAVSIVDSVGSMITFLDRLQGLPTKTPLLYLDLEGVNLSRHGSISIIQIFVPPLHQIYLIDIHLLQSSAFTTQNSSGATMRSILESESVPKALFDVRNDADALFAHFHISMKGVYDVQLMELGSRYHKKERVSGLAQCIEQDLRLSATEKKAWKATKEKGRTLFAAERGGSYEIFNDRPMRPEIIDYCANDVVHLPALWKLYSQRLKKSWITKVQEETRKRLAMSEMLLYDPHGEDKTLSPWAKRERSADKTIVAKNGKKIAIDTVATRVAARAAEKKALRQIEFKPGPSLQTVDINPLQPQNYGNLSPLECKEDVFAQINQSSPLLINHLPIRSRPASTRSIATPQQPTPQNWTCTICHRNMQENIKQAHLIGKSHIKRLTRAQTITPRARAKPTSIDSIVYEPPTILNTNTPSIYVKQTKPPPHQAPPKRSKAKSKKLQSSQSPQSYADVAYPPDCTFIGFDEGNSSRNRSYGQQSKWLDYDDYDDYDNPMEYGLCDKDCGWCGRCMEGVDV